MHGCVRACVRECMCTCQCCMPACVRVYVMCTCQCYMPTCVHVLRACMCTCGVRLHVSRLTFSSLVIRFSSRWIRNQGPAVYHQTPSPEPPATPGRTAGPSRPRPAGAPTPPPPHRRRLPTRGLTTSSTHRPLIYYHFCPSYTRWRVGPMVMCAAECGPFDCSIDHVINKLWSCMVSK